MQQRQQLLQPFSYAGLAYVPRSLLRLCQFMQHLLPDMQGLDRVSGLRHQERLSPWRRQHQLPEHQQPPLPLAQLVELKQLPMQKPRRQ